MTAIFKVVEFYRVNTTTNPSLISDLNSTSIRNNPSDNNNSTLKLIQQNSFDENDSLLTADLISKNSLSTKKTFPSTQSSSSICSFGSNSIHNTLGFNVLGGYLTDFPATIIDVATNPNGKTLKVEEGDIILEINGINTRHLTLNEVYKQLRCCGNRVLLKLKSDPDYKNRFKQILLEQKSTHSDDPNHIHNFELNKNNENYLNANRYSTSLLKNASKSYDNNINYVQYGSLNKDLKTKQNTEPASTYNYISNSTTYSNLSSTTNSHTDILGEGSSVSKLNSLSPAKINRNSEIDASLITLKITDEPNPINQLKKEADQITSTGLAQPLLSSSSSSSSTSSSSSPSSSSSLPVFSNELLSSSSSLSASSTAVITDLNNQTISININNTIQITSESSESFAQKETSQSQMTEPQTINSAQNTIPTNINNPTHSTPVLTFQIEIDDSIKKKIDEKLRECSSGDSDSDSELNVYTPKAVDLPSAQRLAKRLYYLEGFKANDVFRHLSKKNDFSQLVADEYLKLFNFQSLTLDCALRKFLKQFQLNGDAQEKERVLMYFAKRYVDANNTAFSDVDSCHTLTCAIMLLNTDLHDTKIQNKMTMAEFIENLKGLNSGSNFSDALLESLYSAIKNEPLECATLNGDDSFDDHNCSGIVNGNFSLRPIDSNPFLQLPDPQTAKEYKFGWLLRKCCIDSDGKRAPFLKRSWKMFYASLRDMVLYLHKDDKVFKNNTFDNITNAIRIHHAYATVATDYKKKQFVFRLKTADWAEYLFQTSNSTELFEWVSSINLVSAMFSSPPLPGGIGSNKTFQRPLLPVSKTRYTLQEQLDYHKKHIKQLHSDLTKQESIAGVSNTIHNNFNSLSYNFGKEERYFDKDKYQYLQFEIQRYSVYSELLEEKLNLESNSILVNPNFVLNDSSQMNLNSHTFHSINGKNYYESKNFLTNNVAYLNSNNESIISKSMPSTPTLITNLKTNINNSSINFNKSPNKSIESVLPTLSVTSSINNNNSTNNSLKKYNNYLD